MKNTLPNNSSGLKLGLRGALLTFALLTAAGVALPAAAYARDNYNEGLHRGQEWSQHEVQARRWHRAHPYRPGVVYAQPYYEPPVVYAPPPVVYAPSPPPLISLIFPLDFR